MEKDGFSLLKEEIIDPGFCVECGACTGFCNRLSLDTEFGIPRLVKPCVNGCLNCYDHCPARALFNPSMVFGDLERDPVLGPFTEIKAVRALNPDTRKRAQDGGAVTAILSAILERGKVDGAVVVERDRCWRPVPRIVSSIDELHSSAGSKYNPSPNLATLARAFRKMEIKSVAIVDVGCHIRGVRSLEYNLLYNAGFSAYSDIRIYTIGLFCSGSFIHHELFKTLGKDPRTVKKMDLREGRFIVESDKSETRGLDEIEGSLMPSCSFCGDYTAELADLSVGSIGSPKGYSTVISRSLMGWGMLRDAEQRGYAESDSDLVDIKALMKQASKKKASAMLSLNQRSERGLPLPGFTRSVSSPQ